MILWAVAPEEYLSFDLRHDTIRLTAFLVTIAYLPCALLALMFSYRRASQLSKRKLRLVLVGSFLAYGPLIVWLLTLAFVPSARTGSVQIVGWAIINIVQLAVPFSFAYAIVRHQVIPVNLIIRRGLQYLFAKNALRALVLLPFVGILLTIILNPNRTLADILFRNSILFYALALVAVLFGLVFRRRLSGWVDRRFFREAYNQEKILHNLLDNVKNLDSIPEMSRRVTEEVERALHPTRSYLFYRAGEKREMSLTFTSGGTSQELHIPEEFRLLRFMEDAGAAIEFPFPPKNNLPQSEKIWLEQLDARLVVPMCGTDGRLAGLFLLGDKKSEVPYTGTDRALLESLAGQIALVYENVRLKERVAQDRKLKHEVLARIEGRNINLLKECPACGACYDSGAVVCEKDKIELTLTLPVERTINERYRLDQLIGRGGMGAVYEAQDIRLNRPVAVKILSGSMFGNEAALRRFERESQMAARLNHPNIVTVHDYGALETEGAFLVMELARGETLGARLKRERAIQPQIAAEWFRQITEGVKVAHNSSIVHRDLKPDNILISTEENKDTVIKILDFGLAKIAQASITEAVNSSTPVTTPGMVMGTFGYMSPEQLAGGEVDHRSDLFSIGVIVVEVLTGQRPFNGQTFHELLTNILQQPFHLQSDSPGAERLERVLQRCLAKNRSERYATIEEMQRDLMPAIYGCPSFADELTAHLDANTVILET
ncbi:MAG: protein kinase [Pyrinomonadaceae bacterium]|nr:protein kinase [Pyrinomonadaceae bacterium]